MKTDSGFVDTYLDASKPLRLPLRTRQDNPRAPASHSRLAERQPGRERRRGQNRRAGDRVAGESSRAAAVAEIEKAVYQFESAEWGGGGEDQGELCGVSE